jgi:hypothetical protein
MKACKLIFAPKEESRVETLFDLPEAGRCSSEGLLKKTVDRMGLGPGAGAAGEEESGREVMRREPTAVD